MKLRYIYLWVVFLSFFFSCKEPCDIPSGLTEIGKSCDTSSCEVTLKWNKVPDAQQYLIKATKANDSTIIVQQDTVSGLDTVHTLTLPFDTFRVRIASVCAHDTSEYSSAIMVISGGILIADADLERSEEHTS